MGRTLIRCDLTVTQNNNSIKGRIMAKAAVKNLMFSNQEREIKAVRSRQRSEGQLKGTAGLKRAAGTTAHGGTPPPQELSFGPGGQGGQGDPLWHQPGGDLSATAASSAPHRFHGQGTQGREKHHCAPGAGRQVTLHIRHGAHRPAPHTKELLQGWGLSPRWLQRRMEMGQTLLHQSL